VGQILINSELVDVDFATKREVFKWPARSADRALKGIVLHETAGTTASGAIGTWRGYAGKGIGAHFIIDVDGTVIVCADIRRDAPWHAGTWSPDHIGIEVVCPVTDRSPYSKPEPGGPWPEPWASAPRLEEWRMSGIDKRLGPGLYVPPMPEQLGALVTLVTWLRGYVPGLADVKILTLDEGLMADRTPRAGIVAHAQISSSRTDGIGPLRHLAGYEEFVRRFNLESR
jgi:hypothetical protein